MLNPRNRKELRLSSTFLVILSTILISFGANAQVTIPNTFTAGSPAVADDVNANFDALAAAINAAAGETSTADVFTFMLPDGTPAAGDMVGSSTLNRTPSGVTLSASTTMLGVDAVYTLWWVIFNNPAACAADPCADTDFATAAVEASVMNATGRAADANGEATFSAFLPVGFTHTEPVSATGRQLFGPGLQEAAGAEIHVIIRSHGPASGNPEQLNTFMADCDNVAPAMGCYDDQAIVFPRPGS